MSSPVSVLESEMCRITILMNVFLKRFKETIVFIGFLKQEYCSDLPFSSPVALILSGPDWQGNALQLLHVAGHPGLLEAREA